MELTDKGQKTVRAIRNVVIFAVVLGAGYFAYKKWGGSGDGKIAVDKSSGKPDLIVAYNTFTGVEGLVLMNGGLDPNENSPMYKNYGLKVQIKQMDAVKDTRAGLHSGDLDLVYCSSTPYCFKPIPGCRLCAASCL